MSYETELQILEAVLALIGTGGVTVYAANKVKAFVNLITSSATLNIYLANISLLELANILKRASELAADDGELSNSDFEELGKMMVEAAKS